MAVKNFKAFLPTLLAFALISAMNTCQSERIRRQSQTGRMESLKELEVRTEDVFKPIDEILEENAMEPIEESVETEKTNRIP